MAYTIYTKFMRHNPDDPHWPDRDRFVLSAGHGSMLLYAMLHLTGYDLPMEEIKRFRQWGSRTPGHPEYGLTPGVETTTGPLGQGFANAVGMAIAERNLAARFNRPATPSLTTTPTASAPTATSWRASPPRPPPWPATSGWAAHLFYDDNHITIDGHDRLVLRREDVGQPLRGLRLARPARGRRQRPRGHRRGHPSGPGRERPALADRRPHRTSATGRPNAVDTTRPTAQPPGDEVRAAKKALGWPDEPLLTTGRGLRAHSGGPDPGGRLEAEWKRRFAAWASDPPGAGRPVGGGPDRHLDPGLGRRPAPLRPRGPRWPPGRPAARCMDAF